MGARGYGQGVLVQRRGRIARCLDLEDTAHNVGVDRELVVHSPPPDSAVVCSTALALAVKRVIGVAVLAERPALLLLGGIRDDGGLTRPESLDACLQEPI